MVSRPALGVLLTAAQAALVSAQSCNSNNLSVSYPAPVAADGWNYRLVAEGLTRPRGILFDSTDGLVVVDAGHGLVHLSLKDEGGTCVSVAKKTTLVENENLHHGIELSGDGRVLYASTDHDVYSWPYDASSPGVLDSSSRRTIVTNMSNSGHTTRTLLLSRFRPGTLFVSRGSDSNEDSTAEVLDSGHSQIRSFNISSLDDGAEPYDFLDGHVWGWGLRNSVGVAEDPVHGGIWSVENSVDELHRDGKDIHSNNPGEELNFHGFTNGSADGFILEKTGEQNNYGYPLYYAVWSTEDFPFVDDIATGYQFAADGTTKATDESCNKDYVAPVLTFQAHTAPLDIKFAKDGSEAFISFHGSWDREEPVGYKISSISFDSHGMPTASRDSRDAANDILTTPDLSKCPDDCFRPVGLAWDSKGRLWFSSDSTGEIFVMEHSGGEGGSDGNSDASSLLQPKIVAALGFVVVGLLLA